MAALEPERSVARVLVGSVAVDACVEEVHSYSATITDHPVEEGANVADHRRRNPDKLRVVVVITDHPIDDPASHADGARIVPTTIEYKQKRELSTTVFGRTVAAPGPLNLLTTGGDPTLGYETRRFSANALSSPLARSQQVYDELRRMHEEHAVFEVVTSYRVFDNVTIESMSVPRAAEAGLEFTLELRQLTFAVARRVAVTLSRVEASKTKVAKGKQTAKVAEEPALKSSLATILDGAASVLGVE
jgi:hypothetical protein